MITIVEALAGLTGERVNVSHNGVSTRGTVGKSRIAGFILLHETDGTVGRSAYISMANITGVFFDA